MEDILAIERASFGRDAYDRNLFAEYARSPRSLFLVAASARGLAGYALACFSRQDRHLANLISIAVPPEARRRGAASLLLKSTIRRLMLRGVSRLTLMVRQSNAPALRFYERQGFTALRRAPRYYEDREDGLLMRRILKPGRPGL
jgi:[ribosomal protein S18]-alanine N-acetyltransferase